MSLPITKDPKWQQDTRMLPERKKNTSLIATFQKRFAIVYMAASNFQDTAPGWLFSSNSHNNNNKLLLALKKKPYQFQQTGQTQIFLEGPAWLSIAKKIQLVFFSYGEIIVTIRDFFAKPISSFLGDCGAASVGKGGMKIWLYQTSW